MQTAFGLSTLERFVARRKPHELAWTVSLAMFALASFAYFWAAALGWSALDFRAFYLFGAILNVPWLALGTVYLLGGEHSGIADVVTATLWSTMADRFPIIGTILGESAPKTAALTRRITALPPLAKLAAKAQKDYGDAYCGGRIEASLRKVLNAQT